jgi:fatty acid desaturase
MRAWFRYEDGVWPNMAAIIYTFAGYAAGLWAMAQPAWPVAALGVLLTAHALVYSGYLLHEAVHGTIFLSPAANDRLGMAVAWLNGACVASYTGVKNKHLRHHADRLDVVSFDYRAILRGWPMPWQRLVLALEFAYIPAVELLMRAMVVLTPLRSGSDADRCRVVLILAIRLALFTALGLASLQALLLYGVAYLLFLHVLRFIDAFQHTFEVFVSPEAAPAPVDPRRDRQYEHENTYSNLVSHRPWLNLLVLNFPYHNAHHARPAIPWHRLASLHRTLYGDDQGQVITCRALIRSYHRHRVARILAEDYGHVAPDGDRAGGFLGAVGVSFLTAV